VLKAGRHAINLLYNWSTPRDALPTQRSLLWNTRNVTMTQWKYYWSEGESAGVAPCVEGRLSRVDIFRRFGEPIWFWRVAFDLQVVVDKLPVSFSRADIFASYILAVNEFERLCRDVRPGLAGSRLFPPHLQRARTEEPIQPYYFQGEETN
jgi:hypothetical protein